MDIEPTMRYTHTNQWYPSFVEMIKEPIAIVIPPMRYISAIPNMAKKSFQLTLLISHTLAKLVEFQRMRHVHRQHDPMHH